MWFSRATFYRQLNLVILVLVLLSWQAFAQILRSEPKPISPQQVYLQPVAGLSFKQIGVFKEGEKEFSVPWVVFPLLGGHWGLGPTFIADACSVCHVRSDTGHWRERGTEGEP
jgi:hypothetical protein